MSKTFRKDLTGERFGRLTVVEFVPNDKPSAFWRCICDCGNETIVCGCELKRGHIKSCRCFNKEKVSEARTKHGKRKTRLYRIWLSIKNRCNNSKSDKYKDYGGRGIKICKEWENDFQAFYDWSMANGYTDELTIDRIDNDKGYSPENCRWADRKTQNRNKRNNIFVEYKGEYMSLAEASERSGINLKVLQCRYRNCERDERLFRPVKK